MPGAIYYPPADRSQWYGPGNATVAPNKVLWHSTETPGGWPAYAGGSMAPNLTYDPWSHAWRQHFPLNGTARALANGPGYSTNRMGVHQTEVSCYCDPAVLSRVLVRELDGKAPPGSIAHVLERFGSIEFPNDPDLVEAVREALSAGKVQGILPESSMRVLSVAASRHVSNLSQRAYDDMGAFAEFMNAEWGVPLHVGVELKPYPSSYGRNGVRLDGGTFRDYAGHCCHMHAPYNDHGDSGALDVHRIVGGQQPPTPTTHHSTLEAVDMFVAQDQMTGEIFLISGNTKLGFPQGGGDQYPGGSLYAAVLLDHLRQAYPDGPAPKLVALNHDIAARIPDVLSLVEPPSPSLVELAAKSASA